MRCCAIVLLVVGVVGCHSATPALGDATVRIAIHRDPIAFLPVRVAQTLGYFQQENVTVELSEVAGGTKAIEALLGGSVDVAAGAMSDAIALAAEGHYVRGFLVLGTRPTAALAVAPAQGRAIRTIRDLKGRTVGVSALGSASHQTLNFLLVTNGLQPEDVSTVPIGMSAASVAALEHGKVDAAVLLASAIAAFEQRQPGQTFLADTRTAAGATQVFGSEMFPALSLLSQDEWLEQNGATAQRIVRAVRKGMRWMRDQPAESIREMIPEGARMTREADLQAIRQVQQVISTDGLMPPDSVEAIEKFVAISNAKVRASRIDAARTYTNRFVTVP